MGAQVFRDTSVIGTVRVGHRKGCASGVLRAGAWSPLP